MDKIDQVLWEQELREHLDRDADARNESTEFTTLAELNRNADSGDRAELREHPELGEQADESWGPDVLTEPAELNDLETLVGLEELDHLDDTPRAEPPFVTRRVYFVVSVLLMALVIAAVGSVGWSIGYFVT